MEAYRSLGELYRARKNDAPDALLAAVEAFFAEAGARYRKGLITEEDFYVATNYNAGFEGAPLYEQLWGMKYGVAVRKKQLSLFEKAFRAAWEEWKRDRVVQPEAPWVRQCISCDGSVEDAAAWVFSVIDACKVPLLEFSAIPLADVGVFPSVGWTQDGEAEQIALWRECPDPGALLSDPAPQGKTFELRFDGGLIARFTVETAEGNGPNDRRFECVGTVTDYVEKPQRLRIETDRTGYLQLYFSRKTASKWKLLSHTVLNPIPHPKWKRFNEVHYAFALRRETEYRILRLPYLLGDAEENVPPRGAADDPPRQGRIVKLFGD